MSKLVWEFVAVLWLTCWFTSTGVLWAEDYSEAQNSVSQNGKVTRVTLYRNQGRVTRTVKVGSASGEFELIVGDLPENIVPGSLFAEGIDGVEVRAVEYRSRAVKQSPRTEVRALQEKIAANNKKIQLNRKRIGLLKKQIAYLDKMENFVAPTATTELSKGVLDAEALERVTIFNFKKREEIAVEEIELETEFETLQQQARLLGRQINEISNNIGKTMREAVLFVRAGEKKEFVVHVSYLVNSCSWEPSYTVRAKTQQPEATIQYHGLIRQMSGEDWSNVQLTLSTATPSLSSSGPGLAPFSVNLMPSNANSNLNRGIGVAQNGRAKTKQLENIFQQRSAQIAAVRNSTKLNDNVGNSWGLNRLVNELSCSEIGFSGEGGAIGESEFADEEPCSNYELDEMVTLTSRDSRQMVRISDSDLPADFYYVATPVLTSYVYREAELSNTSDADFLSGPINVYLDDRFVGRGEIPTVARGQAFVVGLGSDSQLRTRRELINRTAHINGGNQEITVNYRLVLENYKNVPISVRLTDRLPKPLKQDNIRVTMLKPIVSLSTDKQYLRTERVHGILRWDAEVPARSVGDQPYEIDYKYSLEFDRKYQITMATDQSREQIRFEEIQSQRMKR